MSSEISNKEIFLVAVLLSLAILGFNFPDIFLSKTMHMDDNHRYILGLENKIHDLIVKRNFLRAYVIFPLYKLMSINIVYARLAQTVFFYIPLAFSFYLLIRKYADIEAPVAFFACILPCILPGQTQIPSFIDGSYTIQGLLVFIVMLHVSFYFLKKDGFSWLLFISSLALFIASVEMMDHAVFLAPFVLLMCFIVVPVKENWRKIAALSCALLILAILKIINIHYFPTVSSSVPVDPSWSLFLKRFVLLAQHTISFSHSITGNAFDGRIIWALYALVISIGVICAGKKEKVLIGLGIIWIVCSSIVFLTVSRYYDPRMSHITGFGINFSFVVSVWAIFKYLKIKHRDTVFIALLSVLVLYSGISRINSVERYIRPGNRIHETAVSVMRNYTFSENSQLMIYNALGFYTGGWWRYSSGFLKHLTGRADITGVVGPEKNFYDPFQPHKRFFAGDHRMNGIDLKNPVFIFRVNYGKKYSLVQKEYALQWRGDEWKMYKFNTQNGRVVQIFQGNSYDEFLSMLKVEGVSQSDIAFGTGTPEQ